MNGLPLESRRAALSKQSYHFAEGAGPLKRATRQAATRERIFAMVAPNKTHRLVCTVIRIAEEPSERFVRKPSTLVPWADPYIAGLVRRLQSEVRMERAALADATERGERTADLGMFDNRGAAAWLSDSLVAEPTADLDPPSPFGDEDWDWSDQPRWTVDGEPMAE
jgi:hypothetical protein